MTQYSARPIEAAMRMAISHLANWMIEDWGFTPVDAFEAMAQVLQLHIGQALDDIGMVNNATFVARVPKKYLDQYRDNRRTEFPLEPKQ